MSKFNKVTRSLVNSFGGQISKRAEITGQKYIPGALADYKALIGGRSSVHYSPKSLSYSESLAQAATQYRSGIESVNSSATRNIGQSEINRLSKQSSQLYSREPLSMGATRSAHTTGPLGNETYTYGRPRTEPINNAGAYRKKNFSDSDIRSRYNKMYNGRTGALNKTQSIGRSVFNGANAGDFKYGMSRAGIGMGVGAAAGLVYGTAGNILSGGELAQTDPNMVKNAMATGAFLGAFGAARSGLGSMVRSQNHNITPFMKNMAAKTVGVMDRKSTAMALAVAGMAATSESHLTRSISSSNFSQ